MSEKLGGDLAVEFEFVREGGKVVDVRTNSTEVNQFLSVIKLSRAYNTWLGYAYDLKTFFDTICLPPRSITRLECLRFMEEQDRAGLSSATINRRLAALSSLFSELHIYDPDIYPNNPVYPFKRSKNERRRSSSLYRRSPQRIPDIVASDQLETLFSSVKTWRDRTLIMLMWISCLRISEAVSIEFDDIEISNKTIVITHAKGGYSRTVFMDDLTLKALNRYLDMERGDIAPDESRVFVALKGKAKGKPLTVNALQKLLDYHAKRGLLSNFHAHLLRHTGITQLIQEGMTEPAVRKLVGHHNPASLQPYLHLRDDYVANEFNLAQQQFDMTAYRLLFDKEIAK